MTDWFRSLALLGVAFAGVVGATILFAVILVPAPASSSQGGRATPTEGAGTPAATVAPVGSVPEALGGALAVTGDSDAIVTLDRSSTDGRFGLLGDDARIFFGEEPLTVVQMNVEGLSFFPDPDECEVTPGELNPAIGVAGAHVVCRDVADVRGNGTVTVEGTLGLPGTILGLRGDIPPSGGTVEVGDETLVFDEAIMYIFGVSSIPGEENWALQVLDGEWPEGNMLSFNYDLNTHELTFVQFSRDGTATEIPEDACDLATREMGVLSPWNTAIEVTLECSEVELAGIGPVPIRGTLLVEQVEAYPGAP